MNFLFWFVSVKPAIVKVGAPDWEEEGYESEDHAIVCHLLFRWKLRNIRLRPQYLVG